MTKFWEVCVKNVGSLCKKCGKFVKKLWEFSKAKCGMLALKMWEVSKEGKYGKFICEKMWEVRKSVKEKLGSLCEEMWEVNKGKSGKLV